jgi:orotidine-5'-phosphate decarboxylase
MIPTLENPICVALDSPDQDTLLATARATKDHVGVFKIGLTAFASGGPRIVKELSAERPVFLDLKLHDIPMQVEGAVEAVAASGARYTTVHASGGPEMLRAAARAAGDVVVLAVTVLTSLADAELRAVGISGSTEDAVVRLAEIALDAGVPGLVCSPLELDVLRSRFGPSNAGGPLLVVPGIRGEGAGEDDQRRTLSARAAIDRGADMIVVGRPITASGDPAGAARALRAEVA